MLVCRTCLTKEDLCPLFGELSAVRFDSIQLLKATGIRILENDGLPQAVCKPCLKIIKIVLNFKEISEKANEILRNTKNIKIENNYDNQNEFRSIYDDVINGNESENPFFNDIDSCFDVKFDINPKDDTKVLKTSHSETDIKKLDTENSEDVNKILIFNLREEKFKKGLEETIKCKSKTENKAINSLETQNSKAPATNNRNITKNKKSNLDLDTNLTIDDLESTDSESATYQKNYYKKLSIEDLESTDSDSTYKKKDLDVKKPNKKAISTSTACWAAFNKYIRTNKIKQKRKTFAEIQERNEPYMALAVRPPPHSEGPHYKVPIECKKCHKQLSDRSSFLSHAKKHFEPEFTCEVCGKQFHTRNHMGYHQQRRHGLTKRLSCSQCGFRSVDKITLMNHVRLEHTGERPYTCAECGMSFRMRRAIVQHMQKHFVSKDQKQCDRCPAIYNSLSRLWSHRDRVHLNTYTFPCYLCPDIFKSRAVVKKHLLTVHGVAQEQQLKVKLVKIKK